MSRTNSAGSTINGKQVGFPGVGVVDCPFEVSEGLPLAGGLAEAERLLGAAYEMAHRMSQRDDDNQELTGLHFLIGSAGALITSLKRGFENHPLAKQNDGYHA